MKNIEVGVIAEHGRATETMAALARLTQHGCDIHHVDDIMALWSRPASDALVDSMMRLPLHGTIKRFTPITVAIVGASRRFLAQARTNQVGFNYVSASLQYSDYSGKGQFVVPYRLIEADHQGVTLFGKPLSEVYQRSCAASMDTYALIAHHTDNDTAGYAAPQGLRNVLIMQGNHEAWLHFITTRACNRNTEETQYVALRIWEELLKTDGGEQMFKYAGAACTFGVCPEGKFCCGHSCKPYTTMADEVSLPRRIIDDKWPLLKEV